MDPVAPGGGADAPLAPPPQFVSAFADPPRGRITWGTVLEGGRLFGRQFWGWIALGVAVRYIEDSLWMNSHTRPGVGRAWLRNAGNFHSTHYKAWVTPGYFVASLGSIWVRFTVLEAVHALLLCAALNQLRFGGNRFKVKVRKPISQIALSALFGVVDLFSTGFFMYAALVVFSALSLSRLLLADRGTSLSEALNDAVRIMRPHLVPQMAVFGGVWALQSLLGDLLLWLVKDAQVSLSWQGRLVFILGGLLYPLQLTLQAVIYKDLCLGQPRAVAEPMLRVGTPPIADPLN